MERSKQPHGVGWQLLSKAVVNRAVGIGSLVLCTALGFSQVATVNGSLSAGYVNNVAYVDGVTNTSPQSIYAANPSFSGDVYWPNIYGMVTTISTDPFLNTVAPSTPTVAIQTSGNSCATPVPNGDYEEVELALYDIDNNVVYTPPAITSTSGNGSQCYQVTVPSGDIIAGFRVGAVYGQACSTLSGGFCPGFAPTLQSVGTASTAFTFNSSNVTPYTNFNSTSASTGSGAQPIAPDAGLLVPGVRLHLQGMRYVETVPIVVPNPGKLEGTLVGNAPTGSLPSATTQVNLSLSYPNGVPVSPAPVGFLSSSGGSGSLGNSLIVQTALTWGTSSPYNKIISLSRPETFPAFTGTLSEVSLLNPLPAYGFWPWQNGTTYWVGEMVDDETASPSLWQLTSVLSGYNYTSEASGNPFTGACSSVGITAPDGNGTWTCALRNAAWAGSTNYSPGDEVWDSTNQVFQEEVGAVCESAPTTNGAPAFSTHFAGTVTETATAGSVKCKWQNIAKNGIPHPGYLFYSNSCMATYSSSPGTWATCVDAVAGYTSGPQYSWSGCTNLGLGSLGQATCQSDQSVQTTSIYATGGNSAPPNNITVNSGACPPGLPNPAWSGGSVYFQMSWATPTGMTPPFAEFLESTSSGDCITITPPSLANSPPNAVGYVIGDNTVTLNEFFVPVDGQNVIAGTGGAGSTINGLQHGTIIPLGATATVVKDIALNTSSGASLNGVGLGTTRFGYVNTTDNMISLGGSSALQAQSGGSQYDSVLSTLNLSCERTYNAGETYGGGIENHNGQEQSGVDTVQFQGCEQYDFYIHDTGAQNTSLGKDIHDAGVAADYKEAFIAENAPAVRGAFGGSFSGPRQAPTTTGPCTASSCANAQNRNGLHVYYPLWSNLGGGNVDIEDGTVEAALFGFECSNCTRAKVGNFSTTSVTGRQSAIAILFDQGSHDEAVENGTNGAALGCAIADATLSPVNLNGGSGCLTSQKTVGFLATGNIGGIANAGEPFITTDPGPSVHQNLIGFGQASESVTNIIPGAGTDTKVVEFGLPSAFLNQQGRTLRFNTQGIYTTAVSQTPTIQWKVKLCTVSGCGSGTVVTGIAFAATGATNASVTNQWKNYVDLGTDTTGTVGKVFFHGTSYTITGATGGTTLPAGTTDTNATANATTIDLTGALFLDLQVNMSTNAGSNTVVANLSNLGFIGP